MSSKIKSLTADVAKWASSGLKMAGPETLQERYSTCLHCEFWDQNGFMGTGKCTKCGCSGAKLHMATSKCPIDKWGPVTPSVE